MKKRFFLLPLCVLMSTLCFFASCNSGDENTIPPTLEDFTYKLSDDSTYYILTGVGIYSNSQLIIPSYYNNKPVKEIGENGFKKILDVYSYEKQIQPRIEVIEKVIGSDKKIWRR